MPEIRILLIEDEVTSREIFRLILGDMGYVVDVVASALQGPRPGST